MKIRERAYATIMNVQRRLTEEIIDINRSSQTKEGFAQSMKMLFREYDSKPFLYNVLHQCSIHMALRKNYAVPT